MKEKLMYPAALQLFAEGGADGGDAGEGTADAGQKETGENGNKFRNVVFGKDPAAQDSAAKKTEETETGKKADFKSLIEGDYKEDFGKAVEDILKPRLKNLKETEASYNELKPLLDMLGRKHGVDPSDTKALVKAVEDDDAYYEEEALERGISVAELKNIRRMEREIAQLRAVDRDREAQIRAEQDVARWMKQAEDAKAEYPGLDLKQELQNEQFVRLLQNGIDVGNAYLVVHARDVVPAAIQQAAEKGKAAAAAAVAAGANRPKESGAGGSGGVIYKNDPSQWTDEEFEEAKRRVRSGARIVL